MELADSIIRSNCEIKVYDIQKDLTPNIETLRNISKDKKAVLILSSFFGKNTYSEEFIKVLENMEIPIILDEAQSFPNISLNLHNAISKCAILISFGKSKPISGIGGGAIINKNLLKEKLIEKNLINDKKYICDILYQIKERVLNKVRKYMKKTPLNLDKYKSLEELILDKKELIQKTEAISKLQIIVAYYRLKNYIKKYEKRKDFDYKINNIFGDKLLCDYNYIPLICNNENRYETMQELGKKGIQCTIYYYPLHLIPFYTNKFELENCINTENIFSKIIIVPFSIDYKKKNLQEIIKIIENKKDD